MAFYFESIPLLSFCKTIFPASLMSFSNLKQALFWFLSIIRSHIYGGRVASSAITRTKLSLTLVDQYSTDHTASITYIDCEDVARECLHVNQVFFCLFFSQLDPWQKHENPLLSFECFFNFIFIDEDLTTPLDDFCCAHALCPNFENSLLP